MKTPASTSDDEALGSDALARRAWDWLRLLTSREASEADVQQFRQWVQSSAAHQAAYREAKALWDTLKPSAGLVASAQPGLVAGYVGAQRNRARTRRAFLGTAMACAGVAGVALVYPPLGLWPAASEWGADDRTAAGEQRTLALASGVEVTLNTRTSMRREVVDGHMAGVGLLAGEVAIDLQGERPFAVVAGAGRSTARAGGFEVRYVGERVCVTCIAGAVQVAHPSGARRLQAGQQLVYDTRTAGGIVGIDPEQASAWRRGMLIFRQARLADVIEEINRYRAGRVVLLNASAGDRPVSGHFRIAALDQAIEQLRYAFDLDVQSLVGGVVLLT
ncbi:FecR domain-containing protein [Pigmentiphaga sp.]|uniref:FecR family protein n=1 Tax=Pigmentiphaga sp. TaxID=1977564 RepID=UPI0025E99CD4|nr:FecR domain-containing protein [Pigmentiphaga sp.]